MARYRAMVTRTRTVVEHAIVYTTSSADEWVEKDALRLSQQAAWTPDSDTTTTCKLAHSEKVG